MELQDLPVGNPHSWGCWMVLMKNLEETGLPLVEDRLQEAEMMGLRPEQAEQVQMAEHQETSWAWTVLTEAAGWGREQDQLVWLLLGWMAEIVTELQTRKRMHLHHLFYVQTTTDTLLHASKPFLQVMPYAIHSRSIPHSPSDISQIVPQS